MSRPIMLDMIMKQNEYHKYENIELIQRREDENIVLQGEHVVYVLKKNEAIIWSNINGENTVNDIILKTYEILSSDNHQYDFNSVKKSILEFLEKLINEELISEC